MTDRLYYHDSYVTSFRAVLAETGPDRRVYLDRTAFYPASGGQPNDLGTLGGVSLADVVDEGGRIAHVLTEAFHETPPGSTVEGRIDWARRFDHMQQHTGQHLLSAVFLNLFGAPTLSFHMGAEASTVEIARPSLEPAEIRAAEEQANAIVFENRPVQVSFEDPAEGGINLRKASAREGILRVISIADLDRSACGGTHVRATGEIGPILVRHLDKVRGNVRVEFLCGMRAVRRARADYDALSAAARSFSSPIDLLPELVSAQMARVEQVEKERRKLGSDLAQMRGRQLYSSAAPGSGGVRRTVQRVRSITDEVRTQAQAFTSGERSVYIAIGEDPPAILVATSKDSGMDAGQVVKSLVTRLGGRGGGSAVSAQGSVPKERLPELSDAVVLDAAGDNLR